MSALNFDNSHSSLTDNNFKAGTSYVWSSNREVAVAQLIHVLRNIMTVITIDPKKDVKRSAKLVLVL